MQRHIITQPEGASPPEENLLISIAMLSKHLFQLKSTSGHGLVSISKFGKFGNKGEEFVFRLLLEHVLSTVSKIMHEKNWAHDSKW